MHIIINPHRLHINISFDPSFCAQSHYSIPLVQARTILTFTLQNRASSPEQHQHNKGQIDLFLNDPFLLFFPHRSHLSLAMGDSVGGVSGGGPTRENSLGSLLKRNADSYKESEGRKLSLVQPPFCGNPPVSSTNQSNLFLTLAGLTFHWLSSFSLFSFIYCLNPRKSMHKIDRSYITT